MKIKFTRPTQYFLLLSFAFSLSIAQAPDTLWTKTHGNAHDDFCCSGQQTFDGCYVITGETWLSGWLFYLLKTDSLGDTLWIKTYPLGEGEALQQTADSGYIIAASIGIGGPFDFDICLIKTDEWGDTVWTRTYGGDSIEWPWSVQQTFDGGYIIIGETVSFGAGNMDVYVLKTDSLGDTLWTRTYGGTGGDQGLSVQQIAADSGYIIAASTNSFGAGGWDIWLLRINPDGDTIWTTTYGGIEDDASRSIQQTADSRYVVVGGTWSSGAGMCDVYFLKVNSNGDTLWTRTYGGIDIEGGYSVQETRDGGYIIAGHTKSYGNGDRDVYLIKTDEWGDTVWTRTYGGANYDNGNIVQQTTDGGYIIFGRTRSFGAGALDIYMIKTNPFSLLFPNGGEILLCDSTYNITWFWEKPPNGFEYDINLYLSTDGGVSYPYPITGILHPDSNYMEWTVPYINSTTCRVLIEIDSVGISIYEDESDSNFTISEVSIEEGTIVGLILPYLEVSSNPSNDAFNINFQIPEGVDNRQNIVVSLNIYDAAGRVVKDIPHLTLNALRPTQISWDGTDYANQRLPSGVYFLKLEAGDYSTIEKILLIN